MQIEEWSIEEVFNATENWDVMKNELWSYILILNQRRPYFEPLEATLEQFVSPFWKMKPLIAHFYSSVYILVSTKKKCYDHYLTDEWYWLGIERAIDQTLINCGV